MPAARHDKKRESRDKNINAKKESAKPSSKKTIMIKTVNVSNTVPEREHINEDSNQDKMDVPPQVPKVSKSFSGSGRARKKPNWLKDFAV